MAQVKVLTASWSTVSVDPTMVSMGITTPASCIVMQFCAFCDSWQSASAVDCTQQPCHTACQTRSYCVVRTTLKTGIAGQLLQRTNIAYSVIRSTPAVAIHTAWCLLLYLKERQ